MLNFSFAFVAICGTKPINNTTALLIAPFISSLTAVVPGVQARHCVYQVESAHGAASMRNLPCVHSVFIAFVGIGMCSNAADDAAKIECCA